MLINKKTSTLAVRHVLDPRVAGSVAEVVVKDGAKILGHIAEEVGPFARFENHVVCKRH